MRCGMYRHHKPGGFGQCVARLSWQRPAKVRVQLVNGCQRIAGISHRFVYRVSLRVKFG